MLASIEQALRQPDGFASYEELRQWIQQTHQVQVQSQDAVSPGAHKVPGHTQRTAPQPHKKTLMPLKHCKRRRLLTCRQQAPIPRTVR